MWLCFPPSIISGLLDDARMYKPKSPENTLLPFKPCNLTWEKSYLTLFYQKMGLIMIAVYLLQKNPIHLDQFIYTFSTHLGASTSTISSITEFVEISQAEWCCKALSYIASSQYTKISKWKQRKFYRTRSFVGTKSSAFKRSRRHILIRAES